MATGSRSFISLCLFGLLLSVSTTRRIKRELKFPKGAVFDAAVALTSSLPKGFTDGFVHVLEFHLKFPFPDEFAIGEVAVQKKTSKLSYYKAVMTKNGAKKKFRGRRNVKNDQRKKLLLKVEDAITRIGFNGRDCVSRFQCELRHVSAKDSLLEELIVSLFRTGSKFSEKECEGFRLSCPISLLHAILHSKQMLTGME